MKHISLTKRSMTERQLQPQSLRIRNEAPCMNPCSQILFLSVHHHHHQKKTAEQDLDISQTFGGVAQSVMRWAVAASPEAQTPAQRREDWAVRGPDAARCTQLSRCWQRVILRARLTATDTDGIKVSPVKLHATASTFISTIRKKI